MDDLVFAPELTGALFILLFTCLMLPVLYYIWTAYKRRLNHLALLAGLSAFFIFGYALSGFLLGTFAPMAAGEKTYPTLYALGRALLTAASETVGIWAALLALSKRSSSPGVPNGLGLGFRLFDLLILGGINGFTRLGLMLAVNKDGLDAVLKSVNPEEAEKLRAELVSLSEMAPHTFIMSAADYVCMFVVTAAVTRIIWYSIEGGTKGREKNPLLFPAGFGLRFAAGLPLELYLAGGNDYRPYALAGYIITAAIAAFAVYLSQNREDGEAVRAQRLKPRMRRR